MSKPIPNSRMGSLFSKKKDTGIMSKESEDANHESLLMSDGSRDKSPEEANTKHESLLMKHDSGIMNIDPQVLNAAIAQGRKDPRISTYSPLVVIVLRYLRKTTPEFSMSETASNLLETAIREKYPELSEQIEKALSDKKKLIQIERRK